jgi:hypothetical protein
MYKYTSNINNHTFFDLHDLLVSKYNLTASLDLSSHEALAIFLWIVGGCESNRKTQNRFKHSGETISRKFGEVLACVVKMATHYLKPKDPNFRVVHKRIRSDRRAYPHLKDCIGARDGTHIRAAIAGEKSIRYIGRTGIPSQNVLAICDFDMRFIYASIGQPGACMIQVCYIMPCKPTRLSFRILQRVNLLHVTMIRQLLWYIFTNHTTHRRGASIKGPKGLSPSRNS